VVLCVKLVGRWSTPACISNVLPDYQLVMGPLVDRMVLS
jgi:hypothetical protein